MSEAPHSALESMILNFSPYPVMTFAHGSGVVRAALAVSGAESGITLTPLRGAMPIVWAADGLAGYEKPSGAEFVELPIGTYQYETNGKTKERSPQPAQKQDVIRRTLHEVIYIDGRDPSSTSITILDEVQKGGTLGQATTLTKKYADELGYREPIRVIAAQDTRRKVASEVKSPLYTTIASNSLEGVLATVVPMALVATDRPSMLDTLVLSGNARNEDHFADRISVVRNRDAEAFFRALGTISRNPDIRHDPAFTQQMLDSQPLVTEKASNRVEDWFAQLVDHLDNNADYY